MFEKLKYQSLYNDFISKVKLTDDQIKILNLLIEKKTIIQISLEMNICERNVSKEIRALKDLFTNYKKLETLKYELLIK